MRSGILALLVICLLAGGCASRQDKDALATSREQATIQALDDDDRYLEEGFETQVIPDPIENWNRTMFALNNGLVTMVAKPVNAVYTHVVPGQFREGIGNFFTNLLFPVRFINNLLQGKGQAAGKEFSRFIINTSAGIGGFFDVAATHPDLQDHVDADFGQTLGVWGVGEGFYLYWPIFGPSNPRDTVGRVGDWLMDPLTYYVRPWRVTLSIQALRAVNDLDSTLDLYDDITKSAIDPYTAIRDGYTQYRRAKIAKLGE